MRELAFGNLVLINLSYTKAGRYEGRITDQTGWHNYPRFSTAPLTPLSSSISVLTSIPGGRVPFHCLTVGHSV